ncbi:MAG: biotin/lipoyl-binding protein, partial [Phycisphaerales bacterium]
MKVLLIVLAVVIVVGVGGVFLAGPAMTEGLSFLKSEPAGTEVRAQTTEVGMLTETISAPGEIEPHTDVTVSARVSAKILQLPFREGDEVKQGDVICKLDDRDLKAMHNRATAARDGNKFRLQSSQANLAGQLSSLEFARRELERKQKLFDSGDESRRSLDTALERVRDLEAAVEATKHSISVAESTLAAAEADIEQAQEALDQTVVLSPMDGVITLLNVEVGEQVLGTLSNVGTPIMIIAD